MARIKTRDLAEMMEQSNIGFEPAMYILTHIANEDVPIDLRLKYSMELMPYLYAKKKDIVVDGNVGGDLTIRWLTEKDAK